MTNDEFYIESDWVLPETGAEPVFVRDLMNAGVHVDWTGLSHLLSNGRMFFILTGPQLTRRSLEEAMQNKGEIIGLSYADIYESAHPRRSEIFMVHGRRRDFAGNWTSSYSSVANMAPGDEIPDNQVWPPVVFANPPPTFPAWAGIAEELTLPTDLEIGSNGNTLVIPCLGFSVAAPTSGVVEGDGMRWVPAPMYAAEHPIRAMPSDLVMRHMTFTGAFEFDLGAETHLAGYHAQRSAVEQARARFHRVLAAVSLLGSTDIEPLAEMVVWNGSAGYSPFRSGANHGLFRPVSGCGHRVSVTFAKRIFDLSGTRASLKGLAAAIRASLDVLAHASFAWDPRVAYILLWSAIECVASNEKQGLTTNLALSVASADREAKDAPTAFASAKAAYGVRSTLVHNFNAPAEGDLRLHSQQSVRWLRMIFNLAVDWLEGGSTSHAEFCRSSKMAIRSAWAGRESDPRLSPRAALKSVELRH